MRPLPLVILAMTSLFYIGCNKYKPHCEPAISSCNHVTAGLAFQYTFDSADIDPFIIHTYKYNDNFQTHIGKQIHTGIGNDSTNVNYYFSDISIDDNYDYKIELPNIGKDFYIHSAPISTTKDTIQCPHDYLKSAPECFRYADYFVVNGDTVAATTDAPYSFYVFLLNK